MGLWPRRIVFGGFAILLFVLAVYEYRLMGFDIKTAFAGFSGLILAFASITAKG
jgi:hypothetical protein